MLWSWTLARLRKLTARWCACYDGDMGRNVSHQRAEALRGGANADVGLLIDVDLNGDEKEVVALAVIRS